MTKISVPGGATYDLLKAAFYSVGIFMGSYGIYSYPTAHTVLELGKSVGAIIGCVVMVFIGRLLEAKPKAEKKKETKP